MKTLVLLLLFFSTVACAQEKIHQTSVQLFFGRSLHATGDASGIEYGAIYSSDIGRRSFWFAEVGGSIHDNDWPLFYTTRSGEQIDASIRYTTAGVQAVGGMGLKVLQKNRHEINFRLGALVRYQSSSYWDAIGVYYVPSSGMDFPVVSFANTSPKRTMGFGGRLSFSYAYTFNSKLFLSANGSTQLDSNGDAITAATLGIGKKF
jgi:hypothetical protein